MCTYLCDCLCKLRILTWLVGVGLQHHSRPVQYALDFFISIKRFDVEIVSGVGYHDQLPYQGGCERL